MELSYNYMESKIEQATQDYFDKIAERFKHYLVEELHFQHDKYVAIRHGSTVYIGNIEKDAYGSVVGFIEFVWRHRQPKRISRGEPIMLTPRAMDRVVRERYVLVPEPERAVYGHPMVETDVLPIIEGESVFYFVRNGRRIESQVRVFCRKTPPEFRFAESPALRGIHLTIGNGLRVQR